MAWHRRHGADRGGRPARAQPLRERQPRGPGARARAHPRNGGEVSAQPQPARLDDMKAEDTVTIDLTGKSTIADTMIVTSGRSNRHVGSVADRVLEDLSAAGLPARVEGMPHCDWVLIDAGDVIVHVFRPEVRAFYNLEKMWAPARPHGRRAS